MNKAWLLLLFLVPLPRLGAQETWNLDRCLQYAREHNIGARQARLQALQKQVDWQTEKLNWTPALNAGTRANWNYGLTQNLTTGVLENQTVFGNSVSLSADMPLFSGFALHVRRYMARLNLDLENNRYASVLQNLQTDIINAYLSVLAARENLRMSIAQENDTRRQVEKMQELVRAGARPVSDLKDLEAQLANDELQSVRARNSLRMARLQLGQLLQLDDPGALRLDTLPSHFPINEALILDTPENLIRRYAARQPSILMAENQMALSRAQLRLARSRFYPSLSLFTNWNSRFMDRPSVRGVEIDPDHPYRIIGITEQSHENVLAPNYRRITGPPDPYFTQLNDNRGFVVGLSLNIPLFNRLTVRSQVRKAKIGLDAARLQRQNADLQFRNLVYRLYTDVQNARAKREATRRNYEAARTAYDYAVSKLDAGVISTYDFSNVKSRKIRARAQYISAKYEYMLKLKLLENILTFALNQNQ